MFQVIKAAKLLSKPPLKVDFEDEQEMRCVYSLIYDVFRCESMNRPFKTILDEKLKSYPEVSSTRLHF